MCYNSFGAESWQPLLSKLSSIIILHEVGLDTDSEIRDFVVNGQNYHLPNQSYKSGRAFRIGFSFGPGLGLKLKKISGLIQAWDVLLS